MWKLLNDNKTLITSSNSLKWFIKYLLKNDTLSITKTFNFNTSSSNYIKFDDVTTRRIEWGNTTNAIITVD